MKRIFTLIVLLAICTSGAAAQGTVADSNKLTETQRYYYVAGYLNGFVVASLAAQAPGDCVTLLQKGFDAWPVPKVVAIFDNWIQKNPDKRTPDWTARIGLYAAMAEACGWAQTP
jgi:hypothetical protein